MKRFYLIFGVFGLLLLLAAGAYTAAGLIASPESEADAPGVQIFEDVVDDGSGPRTFRTRIDPAAELPTEESEAGGLVTRVEDNSIFVGTGNTMVNVQIVDGEPQVATEFSGPEIEVVVGRDTVIFQDVTKHDFDGAEGGEFRFQQEVKQVDSIDDIKEGDSLQVWGRRSGDRVVADTIVFGPGAIVARN